MNILLPVYQHPVLTVLIDDSQSFLDSIVFQLNSKSACKTFTNTQAALDWLENAQQYFASHAIQPIRVGYDDESMSLERRNASIDLDEIYHIVLNRQRFNVPAIIVVDYSMPQMNGAEFCAALSNMPCKKILLTGQADERVAVNAFNNKLIDYYIKKNLPNAFEQLETIIADLTKSFFIEQTSTLKDLLSRHSYSFLKDPAIALLVDELYHYHGFIEHYLFPNPTGILFFNAYGKASLMVIETEASLNVHIEVAQSQNAPQELLLALQGRRRIPFFSDNGGMFSSEMSDSWQSYCLPSQVCKGTQNYYWAIFDFPMHYLQDKVYSYAEFLLEKNVHGDLNL